MIYLYWCLPPHCGNGPQMSKKVFSNFAVDVIGIITPCLLYTSLVSHETCLNLWAMQIDYNNITNCSYVENIKLVIKNTD